MDGKDKKLTRDELKLKLKATIEASRISRLGRDSQDVLLEEFEEEMKTAKGKRHAWLETLVGVIMEKQEKADEAAMKNGLENGYDYNWDAGGTGTGCEAGGH